MFDKIVFKKCGGIICLVLVYEYYKFYIFLMYRKHLRHCPFKAYNWVHFAIGHSVGLLLHRVQTSLSGKKKT